MPAMHCDGSLVEPSSEAVKRQVPPGEDSTELRSDAAAETRIADYPMTARPRDSKVLRRSEPSENDVHVDQIADNDDANRDEQPSEQPFVPAGLHWPAWPL